MEKKVEAVWLQVIWDRSRKGSPCLRDIEPGTVVTLAEMEGPGQINHIWITVDNKTTEADCFVLRDLVLSYVLG